MSMQADTISKRDSESYLSNVITRFRKNRFGMVGLLILTMLALVALLSPYIVPHDPHRPVPTEDGPPRSWQAPSSRHILGTDSVGRDVFSRLVAGTRVSLSVGLVATAMTIAIGILVGAVAGYYGGWVDAVLMRLVDIIICFPVLLMLIALSTLMAPSLINVMFIIGIAFWTGTARIVRGEFLKLRSLEFVQAARAVGAYPSRIVIRHILPNAVSPIIVNATLRVAYAILMETSLSFLGVGVQEPLPSWGRMLNQAMSFTVLDGRPWIWIPPGIAILVTVLSINFVGDALRDAVDPKLRT